jgi:hypothetical protein
MKVWLKEEGSAQRFLVSYNIRGRRRDTDTLGCTLLRIRYLPGIYVLTLKDSSLEGPDWKIPRQSLRGKVVKDLSYVIIQNDS